MEKISETQDEVSGSQEKLHESQEDVHNHDLSGSSERLHEVRGEVDHATHRSTGLCAGSVWQIKIEVAVRLLAVLV